MENPGSFFLLLLRVFKMSFAILMAAARAKCGSVVVVSVCGPGPRVTDDIYIVPEEKFLLIFGFVYALFSYNLIHFYRISPAGRRCFWLITVKELR